ncbi:MAG: hypothetical protein FWD65_04070, partial [Coriobacteriia bacterium]|nr:hypothetical protein [Coriobacteriia bacterium]
LTDAQIAALKTALSTTPVPTDDITALGLNNAKQVYQAAQLAQDALNAEIAKGSPDPALVEQLAREASSLEALGDRMSDQYPPDGELPTTPTVEVATIDANGFAKTVDANNGYTLLNALNFPDPALLALLTQSGGYVSGNTNANGFFQNTQIHVDSIDTDPAGGDGELSPIELAAVTDIYLANSTTAADPKISQVASLEGIELFPNLATLRVASTQVTVVNPDQNPQLTTLVVVGNVNVVNVTNNPRLQTLIVNVRNLTALDVSKNTNLKLLNVTNPHCSIIDVSNLTQLDQLFIKDCDTDIIGLRNCTALTIAAITGDTAIKTIDYSGFPLLNNMQVTGDTNLTSVNVSNCPSLSFLHIDGTAAAPMQVSNVDITNTPLITNSPNTFWFQYNGNITIVGAAGRTFTDPTYQLAGNVITYAP